MDDDPAPSTTKRSARDSFLSFSPPSIGDEEIEEVVDTLRSDWITTGPKVAAFEERFREMVDAQAALAVNSCTAALHLSLLALGVREGDRVLTTPMTFCSTVNVIEHVGATPVLADIRSDTMNVDPDRLADCLKKDPASIKAIIAVHFAGHPCDMDEIYGLAREHDLAVIEDCAHALPARYRDRMIGTPVSDVRGTACYSFYATKNLTTAEGGMLVGDPAVVDAARIWSLHGMSRDAWRRYEASGTWFYEVARPGYKYNMTDLQAALGLQQALKLDGFHRRREQIASLYTEAFSAHEELQPPTSLDHVQHAWHLYVLRLQPESLTIDRDRFLEELTHRNIGTSVHFIPVHLHPYYRDKYGYAPSDFPASLREYERSISLPLYTRMSNGDVQDVIDAVLDVVHRHRR